MHIMESLLSTTECRKSTKNSFQASCSGPLRTAKKQKNHQDFDADGPAASKDTFFFDFGGRLLDRWCSTSLALFSSAIYSCQGDLATCFTCLHQSKQAKNPRGVRTMGLAFKHACSLSCMQHTPACITCMHSRSTQITGMVTSIVVLRFARTPPPLCHSWKEFFSFCSGNGGGIARELFAILPAASSSQRSTKLKHTSDRQWRRRHGVCCWLRMNRPIINTTLSPKAHRCLKQAHRRRIEDTPLPSPTQTRLNACQLQFYMIYQIQCTTPSASCRSRPAGLVTSFTRSFGLARLDQFCWRCFSMWERKRVRGGGGGRIG